MTTTVEVARTRAPRAPSWLGAPVVAPLAIFAASRLVDTLLLVSAGSSQDVTMTAGDEQRTSVDGGIGYAGVIQNWDGQWYRQIAEQGYPDAVPRSDGEPQQSSLVFLPLYPAVVRLLMTLTQLPFAAAACVVSVVCAAVAMCVVHRLVTERASAASAHLTVTALCFHPAAPVLQTAYTEGAALLLVSTSLLLLHRRRYGWVAVALVLLGLTRPVTIPFTAVVLVHAWWRWRRRAVDPISTLEGRRLAAALAAGPVAFLLWPGAVAVRTGELWGYFTTRSAWLPDDGEPSSWLQRLLAGDVLAGGIAVVTLVGLAVVVLRRGGAVWVPEVRAWSLVYPAYIVLATAPSGALRYSLLALVVCWPLARRPGRDDPLSARVLLALVVVALGTAAQWWWLTHFFIPGQDAWAFP